MSRSRNTVAIAAVLLALLASPINADVRTDEKSRVEFAGMLGRMMNFFGGKAAKEGVTNTVAVKGDRKMTMNENTAQIVDLAEEKVYDLDLKKKSYKVTTFAELRRRMEEAQKKAEENEKKQAGKEGKESAKPQENGKEMQIDVDVKNTGEKKTINGFDTRQMVTTMTMHEKGKPIEQSGGMILTMDSWLGPKVAAMNEIPDFERRYAEKLYGPQIVGASAEQMAAAMAMYPMLKDMIGKMHTEGEKLDGTPIQQTVTFDAVKSAEQMAQDQQAQSDDDSAKPTGGLGGMLGSLAKRAATKKKDDEGPKARATFMTMTNEVLKIATDVNPADLTIPAGFKENK